MAQRTCDIDGCERKHAARGMCSYHYYSIRHAGKSHHTYTTRTCETCGDEWSTPRREARFCTAKCKGVHLSQLNRKVNHLPDDHPVMVAIADAKAARREAAVERRRHRDRSTLAWRTARECPGCACLFTPLFTPNMLTCSSRCAGRVSRRRRRAREAGAYGSWIWSDFMRIARRFDYCCAYCGDRPGQLDPDHVVPISRGGHDSTTNLLPSCRRCNGDKRDLLLDEWEVDRVARGKPARMTTWGAEDRRYWHLTQASISHVA